MLEIADKDLKAGIFLKNELALQIHLKLMKKYETFHAKKKSQQINSRERDQIETLQLKYSITAIKTQSVD